MPFESLEFHTYKKETIGQFSITKVKVYKYDKIAMSILMARKHTSIMYCNNRGSSNNHTVE